MSVNNRMLVSCKDSETYSALPLVSQNLVGRISFREIWGECSTGPRGTWDESNGTIAPCKERKKIRVKRVRY